jgi:hypothetical protein
MHLIVMEFDLNYFVASAHGYELFPALPGSNTVCTGNSQDPRAPDRV